MGDLGEKICFGLLGVTGVATIALLGDLTVSLIRGYESRPNEYKHAKIEQVAETPKYAPVAFTGKVLADRVHGEETSSFTYFPSAITSPGKMGGMMILDSDTKYSMPFKLVNGKDTLDCYAGDLLVDWKKFKFSPEVHVDSLLQSDLAMRCAQGNGTPVTAKGVLDKNNQLRAYEVEISGKNYVLLSH